MEFNQSSATLDERRFAGDASAIVPAAGSPLVLSTGLAMAPSTGLSARSPVTGLTASTVVFIDPTVSNYQSLVAGLQAGTELHVLDPLGDAIAQITQTLAGRTGISSVQIVSHGADGVVEFGHSQLSAATLQSYAGDLQSWATALTPDADILFLGCDVAETATGQALVRQVAQLTGADVAASENLTGNSALGGDWVLEFQTGAIESFLAFRADTLAAYQDILLDPVNTPPTISAIANQTLKESTVSQPLALTISDAETAATSLQLSATSTNQTLFPAGSVVLGGTGSNRTVTLTPVAGDFGDAIITLNVFDGTNTTSTSFTVQVDAVNSAPTLTPFIANQSTNEDTPLPLTFTISDAETVPNALRVRAVSDNALLFPATGITLGGTGTNRTLLLNPASNAFGTANITLSVSDGVSTTLQTFQVNVASVNDVPTISPIADQAINEDTPFGPLNFTISDVETPATALTLSAASSNPTLIPNSSLVLSGTGTNHAIAFTPAANAFGTAVITLSVSDGTATTLRSFSVNVASVNDLPTLTPLIPSQVVDEDVALPITFTISDVETPVNSLSLTAASDNPALYSGTGLSFSGTGSTRTLLLTPTANAFGTANITLSVNDGTASTLQTFNVRVNPVNDAPTITPILNQTLLEDRSTGSLFFTVSDVETPAASLVVTAVSSNPDLISPAGLVLGGTDNNRSITVTPTTNASGTATVVLAVNDGTVSSLTSFSVVVQPVNDAPVLDISAVPILTTINEDPVTNLGNTVASLLQTTTTLGTASIITDVDANALQGIAVTGLDNANGSWEFSVNNGTAWTTLGATSPATARLLAANADTRIRFVPKPNYNGGSSFTFQAWDQTTGTNGGVGNATTNGRTTSFSLATDTASITILPVNDLPTLSAVNLTLNEDSRITFTDTDFTRSYSDVDGTPLVALQILSLPTNGSLSLGNVAVTASQTLAAADINTLTFTPTSNFFGRDSFTWNASDGTGFAIAPAAVSLTINPVNDAPSFTLSTTTLSATVGDTTKTLTNVAGAFSPGPANEANQSLAGYVVTTDRPDLFLSAPTLNAAGTLTFTPATVVSATGVAKVVIRARDSGGTLNGGIDVSAPQTLNIAINPQPLVSLANSGSNALSLLEGNAGTTPFTFTVGLSVASSQTVSVGYRTVDGTAIAGSDYTAVNDTLTFLPGEVTKTVVVNVLGDRTPERNETFQVSLSSITNGVLSTSTNTATGVILNDDFESAPDFNGDGLKDLFWRNTTTGDNYIWLMNGPTVIQDIRLKPVTDLSWNVKAIADFNNDGFSDLLWHNDRTGDNYIWLMNANGLLADVQLFPTVYDLTWTIVATADFNGDGNVDILWHRRGTDTSVVWYMNGTRRESEAYIAGSPTQDYTNIIFGGVSDFNGDGKPDILVYDQSTNASSVWLMNGVNVTQVVALPNTLSGPGWQVERLDKFTSDGVADILWRNPLTGQNRIWDISGAFGNAPTTPVVSYDLPTVTEPTWRIEETGNYTGSPAIDIVWRNYGSSDTLIWQMNGVNREVDVAINLGNRPVPSADWEIQG